MSRDQSIGVPASTMKSRAPEPDIAFTDYPFEILLDTIPIEEISEPFYSEAASIIPEIGDGEAEVIAKPMALASQPLLFHLVLKLRTFPVEGKKLEKIKFREIFNWLA
jgi:hypothetical protein